MSTPGHRIEIAAPSVGDSEWQAMREPIQRGWLTQGPKVAAFEEAFAAISGTRHGLATTSCTTALHLILAAMGVGQGDEVIVPAFTWVATANAVLYCGASVVFADVDPLTYNIDPKKLSAVVSERTRAVIPVHLFGLCVDIPQIGALIPEHVAIIEDAACAAGAAIGGRPAGSLGDAAAFSFHPRKVITTGEGGMVTTDDHALFERARALRNHGASVSEEARHEGPAPWRMASFDVLGFNYRMTDLQAAMGLAQLERLASLVAERRSWAAWYDEQLADLTWLQTPFTPPECFHSYQSYVTVVDPELAPGSRDRIMERLDGMGVATRPGTHSVPELGYYRTALGTDPADFPVAARLEAQTMAIPLHNQMTPDDYERVVAALKSL